MRRDEKQMLTAEELRLLEQRRRRIVLVLALVLVLVVASFFGARPARNAIKGWQARRHAQKAFGLIEDEKWKEAREEAIAAYQLRQTEPAALRAVARFLSRTRQQQAFEFWDQLAERETLTSDDRRDEAALALAGGEAGRATAAIDSLFADEGKSAKPRDWLLAAQLHLQKGAPAQALDSLGKLFAQSSATTREQFQASLLELQSARTGDSEKDQLVQAEAWERLNKLAQGDDAVALDALVLHAQRVLATQNSEATDQKPGDLAPEEIIRRLEAHPLAKAPQKLLAIDLRIRAQPDEREALLTKAINEWKEADPASLATLATWLNGKGEHQRQLDEIPEEKAFGSRDLFLQHVDALGALGRWSDIRRLLESERFPLDSVVQRMYMARCDAQLGNEAAAKNNWERALESANGDAGKLIGLAEYAEKNGARAIAEQAYTQGTVAAPKLRAVWQGRLRTANASRETKEIHAALEGMLALWPNDTALQNDEAYTRLLLSASGGESAADVPAEEFIALEQLASSLVEREPASLPHRTLLALALLKQSRPVAALKVYEGIQVPTNSLTPSALAIHAAVLAANDHLEDARTEIAQAPIDKLLPEEQALVSGLRE